jgi:hypothetical protein
MDVGGKWNLFWQVSFLHFCVHILKRLDEFRQKFVLQVEGQYLHYMNLFSWAFIEESFLDVVNI